MKGEVEIIEGQDAARPFEVWDWSPFRDSGGPVGSFADRDAAIRCALKHAALHDRELWFAEVHLFQRGQA